MVGRQRQRRVLAEAFEQAVDDRVCHLFTVLGAAGVGKSRLVSEFLDHVGGDALVLHGRCLSYGEGITYWPIAEAIREAADLDESDDDETVRRKLAAAVTDARDREAVVEQIGRLIGRFGAGGSREETFWAVRTFIESLARARPVVLLLDDIHWAEPTLLDLIENLAEWIRDAPVLLLGVARHELLEKRPGWGGGMGSATTITLEGLNENESRELIANILGQLELSADLVERISGAAEGNPLFVEEMVSMLIDRRFLERREGGWVAVTSLSEVSVPPTIQALLAARLDGLPSDERAVIERGSVEGKIFHRGAVAELAPAALRESVPEHLRALSRKELVRPDRSDFAGDEAFRFRHLLIRDAAYTAMPKEARADLHERFAAWLERVAGEHAVEYEEILGYHLERAYAYRTELGPADEQSTRLRDAAGRHLASSGERALERGDVPAAIKLLRSSVDLLPEGHEETTLAVGNLGTALTLSGEFREADEILEKELEAASARGDELGVARMEVVRIVSQSVFANVTVNEVIDQSRRLISLFERHGDEWGRRRAEFELGRHMFFAGHAKEAERILIDSATRIPQGEVPGRVLGFILSCIYWGPTSVDEALRRIEELSDLVPGPAGEASRSRFVGSLKVLAGEFDVGIELIREGIRRDSEMGRVILVRTTKGHALGPALLSAGRMEEAEALLSDTYREMVDSGDLSFSCTVAGYLADLYVNAGRWAEAERFGRLAMDTATDDDVEAQCQGLAALARVLVTRGQIEEAEAYAARAEALANETDYLSRRGHAKANLAEVLLATGKREEAMAAFRRSLVEFDTKGATALAAPVRQRLAEIESARV